MQDNPSVVTYLEWWLLHCERVDQELGSFRKAKERLIVITVARTKDGCGILRREFAEFSVMVVRCVEHSAEFNDKVIPRRLATRNISVFI